MGRAKFKCTPTSLNMILPSAPGSKCIECEPVNMHHAKAQDCSSSRIRDGVRTETKAPHEGGKGHHSSLPIYESTFYPSALGIPKTWAMREKFCRITSTSLLFTSVVSAQTFKRKLGNTDGSSAITIVPDGRFRHATILASLLDTFPKPFPCVSVRAPCLPKPLTPPHRRVLPFTIWDDLSREWRSFDDHYRPVLFLDTILFVLIDFNILFRWHAGEDNFALEMTEFLSALRNADIVEVVQVVRVNQHTFLFIQLCGKSRLQDR